MSTLQIDIELLIRMFEWCREESGDDVDLHVISERMEAIGHPLTMEDYPDIVGADAKEPTHPTKDPNTRSSNMPLEMSHLYNMLQLEVASSEWWDSLTPKEQKVYLKAHPASNYGNAHLKGADFSGHLEKRGFKKSGRNQWTHANGIRVRMLPSDTHKYHVEITHPNGNVHNRRSNWGGNVTSLLTHLTGGARGAAPPVESSPKNRKPPAKISSKSPARKPAPKRVDDEGDDWGAPARTVKRAETPPAKKPGRKAAPAERSKSIPEDPNFYGKHGMTEKDALRRVKDKPSAKSAPKREEPEDKGDDWGAPVKKVTKAPRKPAEEPKPSRGRPKVVKKQELAPKKRTVVPDEGDDWGAPAKPAKRAIRPVEPKSKPEPTANRIDPGKPLPAWLKDAMDKYGKTTKSTPDESDAEDWGAPSSKKRTGTTMKTSSKPYRPEDHPEDQQKSLDLLDRIHKNPKVLDDLRREKGLPIPKGTSTKKPPPNSKKTVREAIEAEKLGNSDPFFGNMTKRQRAKNPSLYD